VQWSTGNQEAIVNEANRKRYSLSRSPGPTLDYALIE